MKFSYSQLTALLTGAILLQTSNAQDLMRSLDPLHLRSDEEYRTLSASGLTIDAQHLRFGDTAEIVATQPGASIVRNGSQTGILQLRGLSGDRVAVRVDGMTITPACPNHMDPPLHYAHPAGGDLIELMAGISPVSAGGDHIGGSLLVKSAEPEFAGEGSLLTKGMLGASFRGNQDAGSLAADLTIAGARAAIRYRGSAAAADDLRYPGGTIRASGYETTSHDLSAAWRTPGGYLALDTGFSATRDSGTPALPMDMIRDDAWRFGITSKENHNWGTLENRFFVHDIDHLMDNYSLRPVTSGSMAMKAPSSSRDFGWRGDVIIPHLENKFRTGIDLHHNEFNAQQIIASGVRAGARRDTFKDNQRSRYGAYAEWNHKHSSMWSTLLGVRGDVVTSDAEAVSNAILPSPSMMRTAILADQTRFNAADRSFTDILPAATAALRFEPDDKTSIELAAALKSRAPSLVERYLWTPLNASAGLADGRTYLGNLGLDPETSLQLALAATRKGESWHLGITPFYQNVYNYIQGTSIARKDSKGLSVLQYQNIDRADLYGLELSSGWRFNDALSLESSLSHVRGKNRETGDDLYRIAPLHGTFDLGYLRGSWESHIEWVWASAQNRVSELQNEQATPGYGLLNLRLAKTFTDSVRVEVGVENLLDKSYADHLGGVNRISGGDLAISADIPGAGRFAYLSLVLKF